VFARSTGAVWVTDHSAAGSRACNPLGLRDTTDNDDLVGMNTAHLDDPRFGAFTTAHAFGHLVDGLSL
jgi:hypothetical protein